jgi:hypothetical protein
MLITQQNRGIHLPKKNGLSEIACKMLAEKKKTLIEKKVEPTFVKDHQ